MSMVSSGGAVMVWPSTFGRPLSLGSSDPRPGNGFKAMGSLGAFGFIA